MPKKYNKTTKRQLQQERIILLDMNRRKRRGMLKYELDELTELDVSINEEIAKIQAETELWNLYADENIIVDVKYHMNLN